MEKKKKKRKKNDILITLRGGEIELYCVGGVYLTQHLIINQLNSEVCHSVSRNFDVYSCNYCKLWPKTVMVAFYDNT